MKRINLKRQGRLVLALFVLSAVVVSFPCAEALRATTPPKPGHEFPKSYVEYRKANPELFVLRGGLTARVERRGRSACGSRPGCRSARTPARR